MLAPASFFLFLTAPLSTLNAKRFRFGKFREAQRGGFRVFFFFLIIIYRFGSSRDNLVARSLSPWAHLPYLECVLTHLGLLCRGPGTTTPPGLQLS